MSTFHSSVHIWLKDENKGTRPHFHVEHDDGGISVSLSGEGANSLYVTGTPDQIIGWAADAMTAAVRYKAEKANVDQLTLQEVL